MKRLIVFILALTYLFTTTGTNMHRHFCMGKLADWSLWTKSKNKVCSKCGMEQEDKPNGCCKVEHTWLKIQDDQKAVNTSYQFSLLHDAEPIQYFVSGYQLLITESADLLPQGHAPPYANPIELYKRNRVFRI